MQWFPNCVLGHLRVLWWTNRGTVGHPQWPLLPSPSKHCHLGLHKMMAVPRRARRKRPLWKKDVLTKVCIGITGLRFCIEKRGHVFSLFHDRVYIWNCVRNEYGLNKDLHLNVLVRSPRSAFQAVHEAPAPQAISLCQEWPNWTSTYLYGPAVAICSVSYCFVMIRYRGLAFSRRVHG